MNTGSIQRNPVAPVSPIRPFTAMMTGRYSLAIFLIALFAFISYSGLYLSVRTFETSAAVVNISGRQRMLSQQIAKLSHDLIHEEEKAQFRKQLKASADLMEKSHESLIKGSAKLNIPGGLSPAVRAIYFEPPMHLDDHVRAFIAAANALASEPVENLVHGNPHMNLIEAESHATLLQLLDTMVRQYQEDSEADIARLMMLGGGMFALIMLVLILESVFLFRPLTRRIQEEADDLAASENKLRDITSSLGEGVLMSDKEGRVTFMNPEAQRLMGWPEAELLGKLIYEKVEVNGPDGEPIPADERPLMKTLRTGEPQNMHELHITRKDGTIFPVAIVVTPIKKDGEITGAVAAFHGIKQRKQAEEALKRKTALIQLLQEITVASNEAGSVDDAILACLSRVCYYVGWEIGHVYVPDHLGVLVPTGLWHMKDEQKYKTFRDITEVTTFPPGIGLPGRVYKSGKPAWIVDLAKDSNFPRANHLLDIGVKSGFAFPVIEGSKVTAVLEFFNTEPTQPDEELMETIALIAILLGRAMERKRAEEALRESKKRFQDLADSQPALIWGSGTDALCNYFNKPWLEFTGRRLEQELGNGWAEGVHKDDYDKCLDIYLTAFKARSQFEMEYRLRRADGEYRWVFDRGAPQFNLEGEFTGYIGTCMDVTERKRIEFELITSKQKAEEATKIKDKFVSLVAHDLRTPLTVIIGMMGALVKKSEDNLHENQKDICHRAIKSGENMVDMIDHLLDISGLQTGRIKPDRKQFDVNMMVIDCIEDLKPLADKKEIRIINEIPAGAKLYCDSYLIAEVIKNLLSNSIKFCGSGDEITIFAPSGEKSALAVKDSGCGITESVIKDLFRHEKKTTSIGTAGERGTGLGLPLSYDIMKAHGGELTVESIQGEGCVFYMRLRETG